MNTWDAPNQCGVDQRPLPQIKTQYHEHDAGAQRAPNHIEQNNLPVLPGTEGAKRYPNEGEHQDNGRDARQQCCMDKPGSRLKCCALCCRHNLTSPAVVATQRRKVSGFGSRDIDVRLNPETDAIEVLAQPVVLEPNAGILIGL